jgi:DNA-binding transcriptional MerR regulator
MSDPLSPTVSIGQLATLAGVSRRAIRHYEQQGLLPKPARTASGYRRYTMAAVVQVTRIRRLRELGLSVTQIREALTSDVASATLRETLLQLEQDLTRRAEGIQQMREQVRGLIAREADDLAAASSWRGFYAQARQQDPVARGAGVQRSTQTVGHTRPLQKTLLDLVDLASAIGGDALVGDLRARLADPEVLAHVDQLSRRLKALAYITPEASETEIESLAAALAVALPPQLLPGPLAEPAMLLILLGERPALAQVRCLERAWQLAHGPV